MKVSVWVFVFPRFGLGLLLLGFRGPVYSFQGPGLLILGFRFGFTPFRLRPGFAPVFLH